MPETKIIIAIDGFAACGKSTLAKALAANLRYIYIDSGAMYRAVSLYFLKNQIDFNNREQVKGALKKIILRFERQADKQVLFLNDQDVSAEIRSMEVSDIVSDVAKIEIIRDFLVKSQRTYGLEKGLVMDGRDIGTVVFPAAELKIFLHADANIRAKRRMLEYKSQGKHVELKSIIENLKKRDQIDTSRAHSPLKAASDSVKFDNSNLSIPEQTAMILALAKIRIGS